MARRTIGTTVVRTHNSQSAATSLKTKEAQIHGALIPATLEIRINRIWRSQAASKGVMMIATTSLTGQLRLCSHSSSSLHSSNSYPTGIRIQCLSKATWVNSSRTMAINKQEEEEGCRTFTAKAIDLTTTMEGTDSTLWEGTHREDSRDR